MYSRISPNTQNNDLSRPRGSQIAKQSDAIQAQWKYHLAQAEQFVVSHPGLSLALATGVGLMFGWWVKRK